MTESPPLDTEAALRAAVKADPADKTAKLALADYLDEIGVVRDDCRQFGYEPGEFHAMCARCQGRGSVLDHSAPIEAALLRVLAHPERDDLRLAYADAVEPADKRLAEFIRVQVGGGVYAPLLAMLVPWEAFLGCQPHRTERVGDMGGRGVVCGGGKSLHYRRGFVSEVTCSAADWLRHGDEICERHPVEKVRLTTWPGVTANVSLGAWRLYDGASHETARPHRVIPDVPPNSVGGREAVKLLLPLEWPGVAFEFCS